MVTPFFGGVQMECNYQKRGALTRVSKRLPMVSHPTPIGDIPQSRQAKLRVSSETHLPQKLRRAKYL